MLFSMKVFSFIMIISKKGISFQQTSLSLYNSFENGVNDDENIYGYNENLHSVNTDQNSVINDLDQIDGCITSKMIR